MDDSGQLLVGDVRMVGGLDHNDDNDDNDKAYSR